MNFSKVPGMILFSSDRPGSHAAMLCPHGMNQPMVPEHCSFNDPAKKYTWAFWWFMPYADGQRFTFATVEYSVTCEVRGDDLVVVEPADEVEREEGSGRPVRLKGVSAIDPMEAMRFALAQQAKESP